VKVPRVSSFRAHPGKGVDGMMDGASVALGNAAMMQDRQIAIAPAQSKADALRSDGQTVMFLAIDGQLAGLLGVADPIRATHRRRLRICTARACASSWSPATVR
jgi:cation transport ATPase